MKNNNNKAFILGEEIHSSRFVYPLNNPVDWCRCLWGSSWRKEIRLQWKECEFRSHMNFISNPGLGPSLLWWDKPVRKLWLVSAHVLTLVTEPECQPVFLVLSFSSEKWGNNTYFIGLPWGWYGIVYLHGKRQVLSRHAFLSLNLVLFGQANFSGLPHCFKTPRNICQ